MKVELIDVYGGSTESSVLLYFPAMLRCGTLAKCMICFSGIRVRHFQRQALLYDNMLYLKAFAGQN